MTLCRGGRKGFLERGGLDLYSGVTTEDGIVIHLTTTGTGTGTDTGTYIVINTTGCGKRAERTGSDHGRLLANQGGHVAAEFRWILITAFLESGEIDQ